MKTNIMAGGGTTVGAKHKASGKNNQDSYAILHGGDYVVGVVADGCGSSARSECGAHLMAYRVCEGIFSSIKHGGDRIAVQTAVSQGVNEALGVLDHALRARKNRDREDQRHFSEKLYEYGLCTLVMMVATTEYISVWSIGDGNIALVEQGSNGPSCSWLNILPNDGNCPSFAGYRLDPFSQHEGSLYPKCEFLNHVVTPAMAPAHPTLGVAITTDGFSQEGSGHEEFIINAVTDRSFVLNPHKATHQLHRMNMGKQRVLWDERRVEREPHAFDDDATIIFVQFHQVQESLGQ